MGNEETKEGRSRTILYAQDCQPLATKHSFQLALECFQTVDVRNSMV